VGIKTFPHPVWGSTDIRTRNEGCAYEEVAGEGRKVCNAELHNLYSVQGACVVTSLLHGAESFLRSYLVL
jgi:hypothetical protein